MSTRFDVVRAARGWLGTPFHHQASVRGVGCDCIGLIAGVAAELAMPEAAHWLADVRRRSYTAEPDEKMLLEAASEYLVEIPLASLRMADIPLMRVRNGAHPQHFGILSSDNPRYIIHAYAMAPSEVVENVFEGAWAKLAVRAYRYRALT
jgi:NlpC/P60 family putative phage cell wall peptidase